MKKEKIGEWLSAVLAIIEMFCIGAILFAFGFVIWGFRADCYTWLVMTPTGRKVLIGVVMAAILLAVLETLIGYLGSRPEKEE